MTTEICFYFHNNSMSNTLVMFKGYKVSYTLQMNWLTQLFIFFFIGCFLCFSPAVVVASESSHIVLNFASINELNWAADEVTWQQDVKPVVIASLRSMRSTILNTPSLEQRASATLSWSTLMEYMNTPMDTPSSDSVYAIKIRRILEIAEEERFPVFVPLNGFQWWDNLPELYNWWDADGTKTDPKFFARQKNPEDFKRRFIAGYNPDNKWNVEWQDWTTPMKLNIRNWGGGGFMIAPPPNLLKNSLRSTTYRDIQGQRLAVIVEEIAKKRQEWEAEGNEDLFVGLSIGTEVSLNASVTPADEFEPYGYRGIQDYSCPDGQPTCGELAACSGYKNTAECLLSTRTKVVAQYLEENARNITKLGIEKSKIYTHVWSEALAGEPRYTNYAAGAYNFYSRPGMSFYGYAKNPLSHPDFSRMIAWNGNPTWGAIEYSAGFETKDWISGLQSSLFNATSSAALSVIYNWDGLPPAAIPAIQTVLRTQDPVARCTMSEPKAVGAHLVHNPDGLRWEISDKTEQQRILVYDGFVASPTKKPIYIIDLGPTDTQVSVPTKLNPGTYTWMVQSFGCNRRDSTYSQPQTITIPVKVAADTSPFWAKAIVRLLDRF